jgi:hypothetical protein
MFSGIIAIPDLSVGYDQKDKLKKDTITHFNYKSWLVALIENDLSENQIAELNQFLEKNPSLKHDLEILKQTKLFPDHSITFSNRNTLMKQGRILVMSSTIKRMTAIAAILILLLISWFIVNQMKPTNVMVQENKTEEQKQPQQNPEIPLKADNHEPAKNPGEKKNAPKQISPDVAPKEIHDNEKPSIAASQPGKSENGKPADTQPLIQDAQPVAENGHSGETRDSARQSDNLIVSNVQPEESMQGLVAKMTLTDIFSDDELKEMGIGNPSEQPQSATPVGTFAARELKRVTENRDIELTKDINAAQQTVTYALDVGAVFSVSHTKSSR